MPITGVKEMPSEVGGVTRIILLSLDDDLAPGRGKLIAVSGSATGLKWNAGKKRSSRPLKSDSIEAVAFTHPRLGHG
jgi:hypothetical protein